MRRITAIFFAVVAMAVVCHAQAGRSVKEWLTTSDRKSLLSEQAPGIPLQKVGADGGSADDAVIEVDEAKRFQTMDGFGFAMTGGSAQLLMKMSAPARHAVLQELFGNGSGGIGVSYVRLSIGASDMNERVFSYDDLADGQTDPEMKRFALGPDEADVIPVMREVLKIAPGVKILGSPWSAPTWMKTNAKVKAGSLKAEFYEAYSKYFVRYVQEMKRRGIKIDAVTVQNEPRNPKNTPSMVMTAEEQAKFIGEYLGPLFSRRGINTKIITYDHNLDVPEYSLTVLGDASAAKYVDGSGFHLYEGSVDAMTKVHEAHPDKNIYFTEQMVVDKKGDSELRIAKPVARILVGAPRNWSRIVLLWNLAADPQFGPHTNDGGCPMCEGAITLDGDTVTRNVAFYAMAHTSKFVPAGSVRVGSSESVILPNVAYRTPAGKMVLVVANPGDDSRTVRVRDSGWDFTQKIEAGAVATFVW
jgi:glucosylceramidase